MTSKKPFVEDGLILDSKQLKEAFRKIRKGEDINDLLQLGKGISAYYWSEYEADTFLTVAVSGYQPQRIVLSTLILRYGYRTLFRCECGYKAAKLYMPRSCNEFKCRSCYNLRYKSSNFNKTNSVDILKKGFDLEEKLRFEYDSITRPVYRGLPTKRILGLQTLFNKLKMVAIKHERNNKRKANQAIISSWNRQRNQCIS